jgi:hypothetical protein
MACEHAQISDFKRGPMWVCSACNKIDLWGNGWSFFGSISCRKCGQEPVIEYVTCSIECRQRHLDGHKAESRSLLIDGLAKANRELEHAQARRDSIAAKLSRASLRG